MKLFSPEKRFADLFPDRRHKRVAIYRSQIRGKYCVVAMGSSTDRGPFSCLTNKEKQEVGSRIEAASNLTESLDL